MAVAVGRSTSAYRIVVSLYVSQPCTIYHSSNAWHEIKRSISTAKSKSVFFSIHSTRYTHVFHVQSIYSVQVGIITSRQNITYRNMFCDEYRILRIYGSHIRMHKNIKYSHSSERPYNIRLTSFSSGAGTYFSRQSSKLLKSMPLMSMPRDVWVLRSPMIEIYICVYFIRFV